MKRVFCDAPFPLIVNANGKTHVATPLIGNGDENFGCCVVSFSVEYTRWGRLSCNNSLLIGNGDENDGCCVEWYVFVMNIDKNGKTPTRKNSHSVDC